MRQDRKFHLAYLAKRTRRERNCKLTFSRQSSVFQRTQASRMRFSAYTPDWLARKCRWPPALLVFPADREPCKIVAPARQRPQIMASAQTVRRKLPNQRNGVFCL